MRFDAATRKAPVRFAAMTLQILGLLLMSVQPSAAQGARNTTSSAGNACEGDSGGITLSPGFCATVFADNIGHARHMVVAPNGVVYVNTWSGRYYANTDNAKAPEGGFLVALQDTTGSGRADKVVRFGPGVESGNAGGTGIALYNGALFAETNDRIVRYALAPGAITPTSAPEVIVSGLPLTGDHPMHPFKIDAQGGLYVDLGSATNACQRQNRIPNSPGIRPCTELETRAGIWRYDANRTGQQFSSAERFATGLRNGEGIAFDSAGRIFATQHGRDQLRENWTALYTAEQGANEPAEELLQLERGADYGWPYCYFDLSQQKLVLAPEYGGDGGKAVGPCAGKRAPVAAFPAHWAPNDLAIYQGQQFPAPFRGGAFIAFHGSWNRAPSPAGRLQRRVPAARRRQALGELRGLRRWFRGGRERARSRCAPTLGIGGRTRWRALRLRRPAWAHLAHRFPRRNRGDGDRSGAGACRWWRRFDGRGRAARGCASRRRDADRRAAQLLPAPRPRMLHGQPDLWRGHLRRLSWLRCQRHAAGAGPHQLEMAVGRWQRAVDR